jgi:hypothetical protein
VADQDDQQPVVRRHLLDDRLDGRLDLLATGQTRARPGAFTQRVDLTLRHAVPVPERKHDCRSPGVVRLRVRRSTGCTGDDHREAPLRIPWIGGLRHEQEPAGEHERGTTERARRRHRSPA